MTSNSEVLRPTSEVSVGFNLWRAALAVLSLAQMMCLIFLVYDIFGGHLGLRSQSISWAAHELIQVSALAGLAIGVSVSSVSLVKLDTRRHAAESKLAEVSLAFHDLIDEQFTLWGLTPAERDVGFFLLKGFSTQEIAGLRETTEGTVKAQNAAIYRKAGVSSRAQLVSLFIEDLMV